MIVAVQLPNHVYKVRKDHRGVDLISDALPSGRLWYETVPVATDYAEFRSGNWKLSDMSQSTKG